MRIMFLLDNWTVDPLGVGHLSAALKLEGHSVSIVKTSRPDYQDRIEAFGPDMLAFSITTGWHNQYFEISRQLKERWPNMIHVAGGPHATFFPEMASEPTIDVTVQGEAEKTFVEFVHKIERFGVKNVIRSDAYMVPPGILEQDLDNLPWSDRELLYSYPENRANPVKNVMITRGCPYACTYCYNGTYREIYPGSKTFRRRSVENVISEIEFLKTDYPETQFIFFQDDEFICRDNYLFSFLEEYTERIKLPFHCQLRAEGMTRPKAQALFLAGCKSVTFAAETGNDDIRLKLLKRDMSKDDIRRCAELLREAGIAYRVENMIGLPGETLDEALETLDLNIELKPEAAFCALYQPYPKTPLGDLARDMLVWKGDIDSITPSFFDRCPIIRDNPHWFDNLQKWFGFVVEFPILRPFVKLLVRLPRMKIMSWAATKFRRWCYDRRLYAVEK